MAQDDWHRITLRIPPELHSRIVRASELSSVNSVIISALEEKFPPPEGPTLDDLFAEMDRLIEEPVTPERAARIKELTDQIEVQLEQKMEELKYLRSKTRPKP